MINTKKDLLKFLIKNPEGPVSNLEGINKQLIKDCALSIYQYQASDNNYYYKLTQDGRDLWKDVYAPVNLLEGLTGLFFSKILRIN